MLANSCRPRCKNLKAIGQAPTQLADVSWQMVLLILFKTNWCFFVSQHIDDACSGVLWDEVIYVYTYRCVGVSYNLGFSK